MAITYMQRRRSGIWEFRRMLPRPLAGNAMPVHARPQLAELLNTKTGRFKRELAISLGTSDATEAKRRDFKEATRVDALFAEALRLVTDGPAPSSSSDGAAINLDELGSAVLAELLAGDEAEREEGDDRRRLQTAEERSQWPDLVAVPQADAKGMQSDHFAAYGDALELLRADYREAQARRDPSLVDAELRAILKRRGIRIDPKASWYREAGLTVLRAHVQAYDLMLLRQGGTDVPTPKPPRAEPNGASSIAEAFAAWKAGSHARGSKRPSANTVREAEHAVRRFTEMFGGDTQLSEITREMVRSFRDALARVPTRLSAKLRKLPITELLKSPNLEHLSPPRVGTVNKSLSLLAAITSNAEREGLMDGVPSFVNPFGKGLKLVADSREEDGRKPFSNEDLARIFSTPVYVAGKRPRGGGGEAAFWLPLIALLSGARQGELAQLRVCDLRQDPETTVWFFDIGTQGGRSIKTATARRTVPIHPALERIGLLRYRDTLVNGGATLEGPLWPEIRSDRQGRRAGPWSKWFNRYLKDHAGVESKDKVFHSFRHTFKRMARDAKLFEEMHDALTGHAGNGGVGRSYGGGFGLRALREAVEQIAEPVATASLSWSKG
jgi:integrase